MWCDGAAEAQRARLHARRSLLVQGEGVPDFILLSELTEDALYANLKLRYDKDLIYTYIGARARSPDFEIRFGF